MLHAVIMAGGTGTRFWPASRNAAPKQLLNLVENETMICQTVARLKGLVPTENILTVTNQRLVAAIHKQLPELPLASLIGEPCKRDTAPCVGLAALMLQQRDPEATLVVTPADHVIGPIENFQAAIQQAADLVEELPARIVTFGIKPSYPAEIFGYIQRGDLLMPAKAQPKAQAATYQVQSFREKPDAQTAAQYLETGSYYWNSGIFVWKAKTIIDALAERQPKMLEHLEKIVAAWETPEQEATLKREFTAIEGISIDYAVMEHATEVVVIEAPYHWDDLGGWQSLCRLLGTDENGNTVVGKHLGLDTTGSIIRTDASHLVVTLGIKDCIIVHTENATLVANKNNEEAIRNVVKKLSELGWDEYL